MKNACVQAVRDDYSNTIMKHPDDPTGTVDDAAIHPQPEM
jgi:hypothetical protein